MTRYIIKKTLTAIVLVLLVSFLVFILMQFLPGDPATIALGESATAEEIQEYRDSYGLNDPVLVQYWNWITNIILQGGDVDTELATAEDTVNFTMGF